MLGRILFSLAALVAVALFILPLSARAVPGDYDYSLIFSTDKNIKDGRILVNQSAVITATLVDKQGNPVAADSRASWSMRNTTSFGTTSGFEVASDIKSSHLTFLAPNEPNVQATIEAKTKKGGREYTNNYAVITYELPAPTTTTSITIPPITTTLPPTGGVWKDGLGQVATLVIILALSYFLSFLLANSLSFGRLSNLITTFPAFGYLFIPTKPREKEKSWGEIKDSFSGIPVEKAVVRLFDVQYHKLKATTTTDKNGRFSFLAPRDVDYLLAVEKPGYEIIKKEFHGRSSSSSVLEIFLKPTDPTKKILQVAAVWKSLAKFLGAIRLPLLVIGTILSIALLVSRFSSIQFFITLVYGLFWIIEIINSRKPKLWGVLRDRDSRRPLPLAIARVYKDESKLVATQVTDDRGRFRFLLEPSKYLLVFSKAGLPALRVEKTIKPGEGLLAFDAEM